jgi:PAS domain S-box-containing protein
MFRAKPSEDQRRIPLTVAVVAGTLVIALALSLTAVIQVLDEYRMLGEWVARQAPVPLADLEGLRRDIGQRIIVRALATAVLLVCTLATLWLQHRELAVRRTLHHVRILANNILASLDSGVVTAGQTGAITSINSAAARLLGVDPECVGRPVHSISSPEVPLERLRLTVAERRETVREMDVTLERSGQAVRMVASAVELKDERGATLGCVIHLRDVTERMLLLEQMWRMEQFASLSTLIAGLHHEIKNPITALSIHVQLLDEQVSCVAADSSLAELIGVLKTEIRRLGVTLESFRTLASLERVDAKPTDVQEVLEGVARLIGPQATRQGVHLELVRPDRALPCVAIDREKIEEAVLNLVLNALEAMPGGGRLGLAAAAEQGRLRLIVRDSGPGIPPEIQDHIFRPYFSTKGGGSGVGLTLAEKLVRQHRGRIDFRTGPHGTSFFITLPVDGSKVAGGKP